MNSYDVNCIVDEIIDKFKNDYNIEKDNQELFGDYGIPFEFDYFKKQLKLSNSLKEIEETKKEMYEFLKDYLLDEIKGEK